MSTVVLVHGLWMNGWDMSVLERRISRNGYHVRRFSYASIYEDVGYNVRGLNRYLSQIEDDQIHLVGHSLGGLMIRHLFHRYPAQKPGRIVTLGTPHQGSRVARHLAGSRARNFLLGKSVSSGLLGDAPGWPGKRELGVIAGDRSLGLGRLVTRLPKPNDGTVALEETPLPGMTDYRVVHTNHMGLMLSAEVADLVVEFLQQGNFPPEVTAQ